MKLIDYMLAPFRKPVATDGRESLADRRNAAAIQNRASTQAGTAVGNAAMVANAVRGLRPQSTSGARVDLINLLTYAATTLNDPSSITQVPSLTWIYDATSGWWSCALPAGTHIGMALRFGPNALISSLPNVYLNVLSNAADTVNAANFGAQVPSYQYRIMISDIQSPWILLPTAIANAATNQLVARAITDAPNNHFIVGFHDPAKVFAPTGEGFSYAGLLKNWPLIAAAGGV